MVDKYFFLVGKSNGDVLFQHIEHQPTVASINAFADEFIANLELYLSSKKIILSQRDKDFFLEDINYFFAHAEEMPYLYWVTDDIFITVIEDAESYNTFEKWAESIPRVSLPKPQKETFDFVTTTEEDSCDDNDIGKLQTIVQKKVEKLPIGFITKDLWGQLRD
jgi:hypothetical protein